LNNGLPVFEGDDSAKSRDDTQFVVIQFENGFGKSSAQVFVSHIHLRRVARAFDLAGVTNAEGCAVLRAVCEGRELATPAPGAQLLHDRGRSGFQL